MTWTYTDGPSPEGVGLTVEQTSFDGQEGSDYVLFQFGFTNTSSSALTFHPGFFGDWDVDGLHTDDIGRTLLDGRLMYVTNVGEIGTHIGTAWFGDHSAPGTFFYSHGLSLGEQFEALSGNLTQESVDPPSEVYAIHRSGTITLLPNQSTDLWMAVVAGDDQAQLLANTAVAEADVAERRRKAGTLEITIVDLGILPGGDFSRGWSINDRGQVVGTSRTTPDEQPVHAFVWTQEDGMVDLGTHPEHATGWAHDINEKGEIAGAGRAVVGGPYKAWVQDKNGEKTLLDLPGQWGWSNTMGISDKGEVVGWGYSDRYHAFLWTEKGGPMDLGLLPGATNSHAADINKRGEVVGSSWTYDDLSLERAFIWTEKYGLVGLPWLNGGPTDARAINDRGDVVGISFQMPGRAFLWTEEEGMMDLGTLPGHNGAWALDINNNGDIVGRSFTQEDPNSNRAFLWTLDYGMVNLGTLDGGNFSEAVGINKQGQIVGRSRGGDGLMHAVMWTVEERKKGKK